MKKLATLTALLALGCGDAFSADFFDGTAGAAGAAASDAQQDTIACADLTVNFGDIVGSEDRVVADAPGQPGELASACLSFSTDNPASSRLLEVGGQRFCIGPCDGAAPREQVICIEYVRPAGPVLARVEAANCLPGCQEGATSGAVLTLPCEAL